jgi:RHS repeat-associated protein
MLMSLAGQASIPRHDISVSNLETVVETVVPPRAPLSNTALSQTTYADSSVISFINDAAGRLTGMADPWGVRPSAATYESAGRLASWTDCNNLLVQYRYNNAGNITNINYPGNLTVVYGFDTAGRLTTVKDWAGHMWSFSYDGANRLTGIQYPNGVAAQRGYNADGQLTNYVYSKSGTPFISRSLTRNLAGLKTRETISAGLEVEQPDTWQKHTNDKADRLTGVTRRDEYILPERWRGYTPSYNPEGQMTNLMEAYQSWSSANHLSWSDAGLLIGYSGLRSTNLWIDTPPMPDWGLTESYDGLGARTVRTDEGIPHRYLVDRVGRLKVPLMETDENNTAVRYYIWAPGIGLLAQIEAGGVIHYVHADEIGSTLAMTDSNGDVTDQFAYSPWGELLGRTGTNTTTFTFVGGGGVTWEGGSLYRMGARYYDARLKRWLSADPIGMAGGANLYLYASANPLFWVDLLGLCGESAEAYYDRQPVLSAAPAIRYGRYAELTATVSAGKMEQTQAMTLGSGFNPGAPYAQEVAIQNSANLWSAPMAEMASAAMIGRMVSWFGRGTESIGVKYIGKLDDLRDIPREQTLLDDLPDLGSAKENYYQNSSVLRKALRDGFEIRDASAYRPNWVSDATLLRPERTVGQSFLGAERNILNNKGLKLNSGGAYSPR